MQTPYRHALAAYVAADRHLRASGRGAKTLTQIGREIGTTRFTVRHWLRRDHWDLWMKHWASVEEIWEAGQRQRFSRDQGRRLADEQRRRELQADLDRSLARLLAGCDDADSDLIPRDGHDILAGLPG